MGLVERSETAVQELTFLQKEYTYILTKFEYLLLVTLKHCVGTQTYELC